MQISSSGAYAIEDFYGLGFTRNFGSSLISQIISCFPRLGSQKLEDKLAETWNYFKTIQIECTTNFQTVIELTWREKARKNNR